MGLRMKRAGALGQALGLPPEAMSPERVVSRVIEMATEGGKANLTGILDARKIVGDAVWADNVVPRVLHVLGGGRAFTVTPGAGAAGTRVKDTFDVVKFGEAWSDMTPSAKDALIVRKQRYGLRDDLDALAVLARTKGRLEKLSASELEDIMQRIPIVGNLARFSVGNWVGQTLTHITTSGFTGGLHLPPALAAQGAAYITAKILSRPATSSATVGYLKSFGDIIESGVRESAGKGKAKIVTAPGNPTLVNAFRLAGRNLAAALHDEFGGSAEEIERDLLGARNADKKPGPPRVRRIEDALRMGKGERFVDPYGVERVR